MNGNDITTTLDDLFIYNNSKKAIYLYNNDDAYTTSGYGAVSILNTNIAQLESHTGSSGGNIDTILALQPTGDLVLSGNGTNKITTTSVKFSGDNNNNIQTTAYIGNTAGTNISIDNPTSSSPTVNLNITSDVNTNGNQIYSSGTPLILNSNNNNSGTTSISAGADIQVLKCKAQTLYTADNADNPVVSSRLTVYNFNYGGFQAYDNRSQLDYTLFNTPNPSGNSPPYPCGARLELKNYEAQNNTQTGKAEIVSPNFVLTSGLGGKITFQDGTQQTTASIPIWVGTATSDLNMNNHDINDINELKFSDGSLFYRALQTSVVSSNFIATDITGVYFQTSYTLLSGVNGADPCITNFLGPFKQYVLNVSVSFFVYYELTDNQTSRFYFQIHKQEPGGYSYALKTFSMDVLGGQVNHNGMFSFTLTDTTNTVGQEWNYSVQAYNNRANCALIKNYQITTILTY